MTFELDSTLEDDSELIGNIEGFSLRLINDSRYLWIIVIPTVNNVTEVYQLNHAEQLKLAVLSARLGQDLMQLYKGDKLNVAAIGNIVRQLHVHHVVRKVGDAAWPAPVWGHGKSVPYTARNSSETLTFLRQNLSIFKDS